MIREARLASLTARAKITAEQKAKRQEFWELAQALTPFVAAQHGKAVLLVPTETDDRFFRKPNRKDSVILERVVSILAEQGRSVAGSTFVDVGAHLGTTTVTALMEHGFATAVAVEPDPTNVRLLRATFALNDLAERTTVVPAAISSTVGTARFELSKGHAPDRASSAKGRLSTGRSGETIEIETVTLDGLAAGGIVDPAGTGLLWLDCQKQEQEALRAASRFLELRVPIVFALRPRTLTPASPLLASLAAAYASFVNLRPAHTPDWKAVFRPVDELAPLSAGRRTLTDVLLVPA